MDLIFNAWLWNQWNGLLRHKVRSPMPWVYDGFYTMYYGMILIVVLEWESDVDKHHYYQYLF